MLDWFECIDGSRCYSAKAEGYMAHVQLHWPENKWHWHWGKYAGAALTLEDAKREVEEAIRASGSGESR